MKKILSIIERTENPIKETYVESMERLSRTSFIVAWVAIATGAVIIVWVSAMWLLKIGI